MSDYRTFIIAGAHRYAMQTCRDNGISPYVKTTFLITPASAYRFRGIRAKEHDVIIYGHYTLEHDMSDVFEAMNLAGFNLE